MKPAPPVTNIFIGYFRETTLFGRTGPKETRLPRVKSTAQNIRRKTFFRLFYRE
jgi:hypothetical protein